MTSYNIYPNVPSAPEDPQVAYHLNVIQCKKQELLKSDEQYNKKYKRYTKILNRLVWLNACSSGLSVATGISRVATLITFIGLPVSIPLGAVSLAGVSISDVTAALTRKYQKKLLKVTKLTAIAMSALAVFERVVSKALRNGKIEEEEFNLLHTLYHETLNELSDINCKMEAGIRNQIEKSLLEKMNDIKKTIETKQS